MPKRRRGGHASALIWIAAALILAGIACWAAGSLPGVPTRDLGLVLFALGLGVFVVAAWRAARPEEGGKVGPDINPWGV